MESSIFQFKNFSRKLLLTHRVRDKTITLIENLTAHKNLVMMNDNYYDVKLKIFEKCAHAVSQEC